MFDDLKKDISKLRYLQEQLKAAIQRTQLEILKTMTIEAHKEKQERLRRQAKSYTDKLIFLKDYKNGKITEK